MNPLKKITIALILIFLLPAIFYSVYEISSLNREEEMINEIYQNQLDAILFSTNQFSDDVVKKWISEIELRIQDESVPLEESIGGLLEFNKSIVMIFIADTLDDTPNEIYALSDSLNERVAMENIFKQYESTTRQLLEYGEVDYQKLEPITPEVFGTNPFLTLLFILNVDHNGSNICGIVIDPSVFIEEVLGPRLQRIAGDNFTVSAFQTGIPNPVYTTSDDLDFQPDSKIRTKGFWLMPDYYLGISLIGNSIENVVRGRTQTNLILIIFLDLMLLVGVWYAYRNIRKEINLAQNKSDFVSNVSHELRTPLALISMFAETLELGRIQSEEKKQEYYKIISKETHRLTGIVNKILNFSRRDANKKPIKLEEIQLNGIIDEVLETYSFHLQNNHYEYSFEPGEDPLVIADPEAVSEVVINLLDNAMKYSNSNKVIEMRTGLKDGFGYFSIRDYGVGISKQDQKHIFDKFYRVSTGDLAKQRGTGLGLSLSKQIMDAHKGFIKVESELGKGSTFILLFPLKS